MTRPAGTVTIVLPAFEASHTLPKVLSALSSSMSDANVIVVDDGSADETAATARQHGADVVRLPSNRGKGAALREGIRRALEVAPECPIVTMDSDGQHSPEDLRALVDYFLQEDLDLLIGRRNIRGSRMPWERRLSNIITSFLVSARTGVRIPDSQCGYRILSPRCARKVRTMSDGFEAETEWIIRAARAGMKIGSLDVRTIYAGERSSMTHWHTTKAFLRTLMKEY